MDNSKLTEGKYYYAPHRRAWGVWRVGKMTNGVQLNDFVADFPLKAQAESFVYKMNGWTLKRKEQEDE